MAFIIPSEVEAGDPLTETLWNQDVVENGRFYLPTGALVPYVGATAPDAQFLLCNGAAVSRSTYADLFAVCSTTYGAGDGSTTFNVPDLRGRVPVGAGTGAQNGGSGSGVITGGTALTNRTRGEFAGDERLATHSHPVAQFLLNVAGAAVGYGAGPNGLGTSTTTNNNTGGGSGGNMVPFIVTNYLIKT
jgi:microcystin-dependent protein